MRTNLSSILVPKTDPNPPLAPSFILAPLAKGPLVNPIALLARLYSQATVREEDIFAWPALVEEPFLELVEADDQAAMVVAFYFYNLLRRVEAEIWWVGHYGRTECERLLNLIAPDYRSFLPLELPETTNPTYQ